MADLFNLKKLKDADLDLKGKADDLDKYAKKDIDK